jgi:hypothetical protein
MNTPHSTGSDGCAKQLAILALSLFVFLPLCALARAIAVVHLWHWFVATQFDTRELSYPLALGLSTFAGLMLTDTGVARDKGAPWKGHVLSICVSLLALGCGWIYQRFL